MSIAWQPHLSIFVSEAESREEEESGQLKRSIDVHISEGHMTKVVEKLGILNFAYIRSSYESPLITITWSEAKPLSPTVAFLS